MHIYTHAFISLSLLTVLYLDSICNKTYSYTCMCLTVVTISNIIMDHTRNIATVAT